MTPNRGLSLLITAATMLVAAAGCTTDPYCLTCADGGPGDAGPADGALADGSDLDAGPMDAWVPPDTGPDGCFEEELCNDRDDDCDGTVDEGFDTTRDPFNCGECGVVCGYEHAFAACAEGVCEMGACDVGWHDLDMDSANGCEYRCSATETDDSICDVRDNDCDGMVDEDVDFSSDPLNCGTCGRDCRFAHGSGICVSGSCELGVCDANFYDLDMSDTNGCEYSCTPASPPDETCNGRDDDCDGTPDEGDPGGGGACGTSVGACSTGTEHCISGLVSCVGAVGPTTELCNGIDDDCDGTVDEGDPESGRLCGMGIGACVRGRETCTGGSLVCVGAIGPTTETCNSIDDDCDGSIDDGVPSAGSCGSAVGECSEGTLVCVAGAFTCTGDVGPTAELCDGLDNDCDGSVDEGDPEGGGLCGTDLGTCSPGTLSCTGGALVCTGAVGPGTETCDGLDNDCDGSVDEGDPGGGGTCGDDTGACTFGTLACRGGAVICEGGTGPALETCNGIDDNCDGSIDEAFDLMNDVTNCGTCGNVCSFTNAIAGCSAGSCVMLACAPGFHDIDMSDANGCEYACGLRGAEVCNGLDDDCDMMTDEGLTPPSTFCNPNGVCAGTSASCGGTVGWTCVYPSTFEPTEASCDGLDNDCDGSVDEAFPLVGTSCTNGELGTCLRLGTYVCNTAGDSVECNAPAVGTGTAETCDGTDEDCDGIVDDGMTTSIIPTVPVPRSGGGTVYVMQYEASRPDATSTSAGTLSTHACSNPDTTPWTTVTFDEAQSACCALNPGGTCPGGGAGWRLCDAADWQTACEGPSGTCNWSYAAMCALSQPATTCNGDEFDCDPGTVGDQDCLYTTGSPAFPSCRTNWGAPGSVYDLSGNVKEWTSTIRAPDVFEVRGGSYSSIELGRACDFDFAVAPRDFAHPATGFRCCFY